MGNYKKRKLRNECRQNNRAELDCVEPVGIDGDDWMKAEKILNLFKITSGGTPSRTKPEYFSNGDIPWVKTGDLGEKYVSEPLEKITQLGLVNSSAKLFPPKTVLVAMYGATIGSCSILNFEACTNQACAAFLPNDKVELEYLYYFLRSIKQQLVALGQGGGQPNISATLLKSLEIPLPPLDDQIRIAHLLSKVEGMIARRKQHLQQLDALLKSIFLDMFGDTVRNSKQHKISVLGSFITHLTSGGRGWAKYYSETGKRFIRSLDVQMNAIGKDDIVYVTPPENKETDRTRVKPGDVLLTITGSKIGRVCFVPSGFEEAYISQHVAIIRTQGINAVFLSYYLSMPSCGQRIINKEQYGQAKPGLNLSQINNFSILEPELDLQNHFEVIVEKVEDIKSRYKQSLTDLKNLYGALSQKAFKGELDLSRVPLDHCSKEHSEREVDCRQEHLGEKRLSYSV